MARYYHPLLPPLFILVPSLSLCLMLTSFLTIFFISLAFSHFVIKVVARVDPDITPEDPRLTAAIEIELAKKK